MSPDSKVVPTHINAYKADLAEAEKELGQAQSKVDSLRETIATMEAGTSETPINDQAAADAEAEEKRLANLKRDKLEKEAKKAGVKDPAAAPNKEELAKQTVAAQNDASVGEPEAPAEDAAEPSEPQAHEDVAAKDATLPPSNGEGSVDGGAGVDEVPSQPIVETPAGSDMPPASSEAPSHHVEGDSADEGAEPADDSEAADAEPAA